MYEIINCYCYFFFLSQKNNINISMQGFFLIRLHHGSKTTQVHFVMSASIFNTIMNIYKYFIFLKISIVCIPFGFVWQFNSECVYIYVKQSYIIIILVNLLRKKITNNRFECRYLSSLANLRQCTFIYELTRPRQETTSCGLDLALGIFADMV